WEYPLLVIPFAVYLIYLGFLYKFPKLSFRRYYSSTGLVGKSFKARFSSEQMTVEAKDVCWISKWKGFQHIKESERLFAFYDGFTLFIFAKRYFSPDQVDALQQLIKECWNKTALNET